MSSKKFSRRHFLRTSAGGFAAAGLAGNAMVLAPSSLEAAPLAVPPSERIGLGIIGCGMQGSGLLRTALSLPGVQCVGAAELYDGRATLAKEIAGDNIFTTRDYRELIARKDVDAVIVATPDHWHAKLVEDCCAAGKDVYCEKPMSKSAGQGLRMIAAETQHKRIVQIGSQGQSSVTYAKAREIFASGALGKVSLVEASLGRNTPNGAWVYMIPPDLSPQTLDWNTWLGTAPQRSFDGARWARWRCFKDYGTGVAGDLYVHMITGIHFISGMNEAPQRATAVGGIVRFHDGRDAADTLLTVYEYSKFPVYMRVTQASRSEQVIRFMGTGGVLEVAGRGVSFTPQDGKDRGPGSFGRAMPREIRGAYEREWYEKNRPKPGEFETTSGTKRYISPPNYSSLRDHFHHFFHSVRTRRTAIQNTTFGHHAALACHLANHSYFHKTVASWDAKAKKIRG
ncbi:MAG: Gfo/Idh/MocA family oxidoreductase [Acidobacteria bacterium]|nr:Gfo/Idh/MocA family oxidoreductase [Acidobacteriota bacterium]